MNRREFIGVSAAALAAGWRYQDPAPLRVGLIGCGGRGTGAADDALGAAKGMTLVALADVFEDRLKGCREYFAKERGVKVADDRCYVGFDAYQKLLASDVDYVILATPPGFRPIHFAAAVEAGKHVFMEKPVAVDPVGARCVMEAGAKAREKKLGVVAGTQRRHDRGYVETIQRIHDGEIGQVVAARCYWNQGGLWKYDRRAGQSDVEWQIRNWLYFDWLSGDHIVEQHIHNIDVVCWALGAHPVKAVAVGGRAARTDPGYGHIYDHFAVDYEFPNGVHVMSMCRQQDRTDNFVGEVIVGTKGRSNAANWIDGDKRWNFKGDNPNAYVQEHADLIESIRKGEPLNEAQAVAESTLAAIMGRHAAYTGKLLTWDEMMKSDLDLSPSKYEFGELKMRPIPVPRG